MNNRWSGASPSCVMGCLLFAATLRCEAQGNLVLNHSFEELDSCQEIMGFYSPTDGPLGWFSANGSPDYLQGCVPQGAANAVPQNQRTYQYAQEGESYVGIVTYQLPSGLREWIMAQLAVPLVTGQTYHVSFYANAAWNGTTMNPDLYGASSHVGALFTMQPRPWFNGNPWPVVGNFAHVYHPWILADTLNWTLVSGTFVADSAYQYVILGNHFDNEITDTVLFASFPWLPKAYTLIDNVCVSVVGQGCSREVGLVESMMEEPAVFPNPTEGSLQVRGVATGTPARIMDALGRVIWEGFATGDPWPMDVQRWPLGPYTLQVMQEAVWRSFKFVLIE